MFEKDVMSRFMRMLNSHPTSTYVDGYRVKNRVCYSQTNGDIGYTLNMYGTGYEIEVMGKDHLTDVEFEYRISPFKYYTEEIIEPLINNIMQEKRQINLWVKQLLSHRLINKTYIIDGAAVMINRINVSVNSQFKGESGWFDISVQQLEPVQGSLCDYRSIVDLTQYSEVYKANITLNGEFTQKSMIEADKLLNDSIGEALNYVRRLKDDVNSVLYRLFENYPDLIKSIKVVPIYNARICSAVINTNINVVNNNGVLYITSNPSTEISYNDEYECLDTKIRRALTANCNV